MPALFAACSSEDDFQLDNGAASLKGRKLIDTDLVFNFDKQANTRLSVGDGAIVLDTKDQVAAALIDKVGTPGVNGYEITDGIATNHPFSLENGLWKTPSRLVEGNYLFYYQYNPALNGSRKKAVPYSINQVQYAYDTKDANKTFNSIQAIQDNAMGIGYAFLKADNKGETAEKVNVNMYNLFAFLKFKITSNISGLEVQQILVKRGESGKQFSLSGTLSNTKIATQGSKKVGDVTNAGVLVPVDRDGQPSDPAHKYTADFGTPAGTGSDYVIISLPDVAATSTAKEVYMVIPAQNYANDETGAANNNGAEFVIDVYTNKGVYSKSVELRHYGANNTLGDVDYSEITMGTVVNITLPISGTLKAAENYFVGNAEEWSKMLESVPAVDEDEEDAPLLNITLLGDVELSGSDIAKVKTTNAKDYMLNVSGGKMILTSDATLEMAVVENVKVNAGVTAAFGEDTEITGTLTNLGVFNAEGVSSIKTLVNGTAVGENDKKTNNGGVKVDVKADVVVENFTNYASGSNYKGVGNNALVTVASGVVLKVNGTNYGTIENNGFLYADTDLYNNGSKALISNSGVLSNVAGGATNGIDNSGTIEAKEGSTVVVDENAIDGTVGLITYVNGANVSVTNTKGKIAYVITSDFLLVKNPQYNTLVLDGISWTLNKKVTEETPNSTPFDVKDYCKVGNIVLKNGASIDLGLSSAALDLIEVEGMNNTIVTGTDGQSVETLKVNAKSYVLIPINSKVTVSGTTTTTGLRNSGSINVGGTLIYENQGVAVGTLLGTGTITANEGSITSADAATLYAPGFYNAYSGGISTIKKIEGTGTVELKGNSTYGVVIEKDGVSGATLKFTSVPNSITLGKEGEAETYSWALTMPDEISFIKYKNEEDALGSITVWINGQSKTYTWSTTSKTYQKP